MRSTEHIRKLPAEKDLKYHGEVVVRVAMVDQNRKFDFLRIKAHKSRLGKFNVERSDEIAILIPYLKK